MPVHRLKWLVALLVSCSGASGGGPSASGADAPPSAANPPPASDPGNDPPATTTPAEKPSLAQVGLTCELTKTDGMCNQAKPRSMSVTVDKVNTCNISAAGHELTLTVESSNQADRDSIRLRVPGYPNASGRYPINSANLVALTDAGDSVSNGAAPHGAGSECSSDCTVDVRETAGSVRQVALDVSCTELCLPNGCLKCKASGGPVAFKLAVDCP